jgi:hypothetical protein
MGEQATQEFLQSPPAAGFLGTDKATGTASAAVFVVRTSQSR